MMLILDDRGWPRTVGNIQINRHAGRRLITHAVHDIDGTYSLIRQWRPVMARCLWFAMSEGLEDDYDDAEHVRRISEQTGSEPLPEADRFCVESAGLSALTQMEWAIRRGLELGVVRIPNYLFSKEDRRLNSKIIQRIWHGEEVFDGLPESAAMKEYLARHTPRLFKLYEQVLNNVCRDRNLAKARQDPNPWLVPGSHEFMNYLWRAGVKNFFVTGAVVEYDSQNRPVNQGMYEEVLAVGFEIGEGKAVEGLYGSTWEKKVPKAQVVRELCEQLGVAGENMLIVGDGRAEISIGVEIGAAALSRIPEQAHREREIHKELDTHYFVSDYTCPDLYRLFSLVE